MVNRILRWPSVMANANLSFSPSQLTARSARHGPSDQGLCRHCSRTLACGIVRPLERLDLVLYKYLPQRVLA